ncbi:eIF-2-alpha kinase GCN2 isoform X1 [Diabrotica virgifera virgifera]|uniref:non-specific serine/threonine protein kinase n=2 Tax=Diabrotica virgifera virgifera TaxID=50390 RepID=A0ABM5KIJ3_DIAVI|nr:eIF-2-alpha kinase GCN2 isoform X1 [Diabrotica virgifera virgifera]
MSGEESTEIRQNNELEALQAIYIENLKDLRKKAVWNKWSPLNLSITLTPQQGSLGTTHIYVQVDMHVICDEKYPESVPKISLENSKGLSNTVLIELQGCLEQTALDLVGEEMIFQLCQLVEEFLHKHNKPASKSFYEEMLERRKEQEIKESHARQMELEKKRQYMMEEVQKREEILMLEAKKWRETRHNSENDTDGEDKRTSLGSRKYATSSTDTSEESSCEHKGTVNINFGNREVHRGRCIKHSDSNHVTYSGIDRESGEYVIISEWKFQSNNDQQVVQRQLGSIEQEINYLMKLKQANLSQYYGVKYEFDGDNVTVYLLKEFVLGCNCYSLFISQHLKIDTYYLKHLARGILIGLDYLHRNNVVHRDIKDACVYINESGVVQIANYSIHRRMLDLSNQTHQNYNKKTDIFKFGLLVLSLLRGFSCTEESMEIPNTFPSDVYDFLTRCLAKEESDRFTASQLLNHSFFNRPIVNFSPKDANEVIETERNYSPENIQADLQILSQNLSNGQSRINNEFEFLQHLGKGAYGDVIKVRNKLDGGYYAIKRIQLNPKNRALNKKIVREVKLLSRLNHENVVRYFNSWIETTTIKDEYDKTSSTISTEEKLPQIVRKTEFTLNDNIEALAPSMKNVEVSITYDSKSQAPYISSSEDDSSDDDEGWGPRYEDSDSDSDSIAFEHESGSEEKNLSTTVSSHHRSSSPDIPTEIVKQIDFMYIQMEFCEKSTLRTAIDNNLYMEEDRMWRFFREIVEGLVYIHQQGMIHRDLKPVNIFLDSEDHVKIGDFGLATTNIKSKQSEYLISKSILESEKEETFDESKTGFVGTALYVAPEISITSKVVYSQKVDIFSLGIILFEMCYKPLDTSMERIKILTKLRNKDIIFPPEFSEKNTGKQELLIRWLLDHDISKRPTSQELLQSEHIPPPVLEECELRELVRHTLNNPQLKGYKYLIASCFKQSVTHVQDITYDKDPSAQNVVKPLLLQEFVKEICIKIFKQHGGQNLATPLLMPKSKFYENLDSCVKLMTHFGGIVSLPHDLRVPFARYIAWNGITNFRRYSIERVYREKKVFGFQPRELYECAFDIVTSSPGLLMADAEILYIVYEILNDLPGIRNKNFVVRLNHNLLLKAILLHSGIKEGHQEIYDMVWDIKEGKIPKYQLQNHFVTLGLSDNTINLLTNFFNTDCEISKAANHFQSITKKRSGEASQLARQALQELKVISQNAETYGVKYDMVISPSLVYNVQQYSGMIFQFACEFRKKHKHNTMEVLAAGGRYDSMISSYRTIMEQASITSKHVQQSAVGVSISLDRLVQALQKEPSEEMPKMESLDVVVCSSGAKQMIQEKTKILRSLWSAGIRSALIETTNMEEIREQFNDLNIVHAVLLKDNEQNIVRVRSWDKDRFQEKSFPTSELVENLQRIMKTWNDSNQENMQFTSISRSESRSSYAEKNQHNQEADVDVLFLTVDKISSNARKRYENQIRSQLSNLFKKLTGFVIVLGLSVEPNVIRTLASYLEFETEQQFQRTVEDVIEKHPRHKKYLNNICDEIYDQKTKRKNPTVVLYSLPDNFHKVIF